MLRELFAAQLNEWQLSGRCIGIFEVWNLSEGGKLRRIGTPNRLKALVPRLIILASTKACWRQMAGCLAIATAHHAVIPVPA
jgi:hypothetical protein